MIPLGRVPRVMEGELGAFSAAHPLAVSAGVAALLDRGSVADAAVAAQAVLCVVMPEACGLSGDLIARVGESSGRVTAMNATGRSARATPSGESVSDGGASVTVRGLVDCWGQLSSQWGRLPLTTTFARARSLARLGCRILASTADASSAQRLRFIRRGAADCPIAMVPHGQHLVQSELANLLDGIGARKARWFYEGDPAAAVVRAVQRNGGFLELADLAAHDTPILDFAAGTFQWSASRGSAAAGRWRSQDGAVLIEAGHPSTRSLARRGHEVIQYRSGDAVFGAVVAPGVSVGVPYAGSDWRRQVWSAVT